MPATESETGKEIPPLLSPGESFKARCKKVEYFRAGTLSQKHFEYPVIGIDNIEAALPVIRKRYPEVKDLTDEELKDRDFTYTSFEVEEPDPEGKPAPRENH